MLWLLDEIIDSAPGIPIGNYLSQHFGNLYLSEIDHKMKELDGCTMVYTSDGWAIVSNNGGTIT